MADTLNILIVDEDLDSRVATRRALQRAQLGIAGEVGYGASAVSFALSAKPDIILLSVEEPVARPLQTAEALANALPDAPFIMYSSQNDAEAVRRGMVFGARDYIVKPVQAGRLIEAVNTVLIQQERRQMRRAGQLLDAAGRGTVVTITGAKGGIGKSVISVNLALALMQETERSVVIFDADTDNGDVATMLDVNPTQTFADLVPRLDRVDRDSIRGYLTEHSSGLQVLAGPQDPDLWTRLDPEDLKRVIDLLSQTFDFVVIDTRGAYDMAVRACIEVSTLTLVITTGEVSSIRDTTAAMRRVSSWNIDPDRLKVILNRGPRVNGFKVEDIEQAFNQEVFWQMPSDHRIPESIQLGQPVMLQGNTTSARNIADLARRIAGTRTSFNQPAQPKHFWDRLTSLRRN